LLFGIFLLLYFALLRFRMTNIDKSGMISKLQNLKIKERNTMVILGIESSCDETAVAIIERGEKNRVLEEQVKTQIPIHAIYGGVVPEIASRNHYEVIDGLTREALKNSNLTLQDIELISFTQGPGLIGSLLVGLSFAKGLSYSLHIPLVPVNHISAHIESAFIENPDIEYPLIALVVSGGHTSIFYQKSKFEQKLLSKTRDDAVGEILDKISKFFSLGYPGGPILDKMYPLGNPKRYKFTFPRMSDGSDDFSFSGYKTAVIRHPEIQDIQANDQAFKDLISSFLNSVVNYLLTKVKDIIIRTEVKSVVIAGGVSRNSLLRDKFTQHFKNDPIRLFMPPGKYCTDNASMVAWLGYEMFKHFPEKNYFDYYVNSFSRAAFRESVKHR
jgi:N6-L-threonylcarbamoyladenine synthase